MSNNDAWLCTHANEVPQGCPCDQDCYCKSHTCRVRVPEWTGMDDFPGSDYPDFEITEYGLDIEGADQIAPGFYRAQVSHSILPKLAPIGKTVCKFPVFTGRLNIYQHKDDGLAFDQLDVSSKELIDWAVKNEPLAGGDRTEAMRYYLVKGLQASQKESLEQWTPPGVETPMANTIQPPPQKNEHPPVKDMVIDDIDRLFGSSRVGKLMAKDVEDRAQMGLKNYGTFLQPFNGRDPLVDAYQEYIDGAKYLRQQVYEGDFNERTDRSAYDEALRLAYRVRHLIYLRDGQ